MLSKFTRTLRESFNRKKVGTLRGHVQDAVHGADYLNQILTAGYKLAPSIDYKNKHDIIVLEPAKDGTTHLEYLHELDVYSLYICPKDITLDPELSKRLTVFYLKDQTLNKTAWSPQLPKKTVKHFIKNAPKNFKFHQLFSIGDIYKFCTFLDAFATKEQLASKDLLQDVISDLSKKYSPLEIEIRLGRSNMAMASSVSQQTKIHRLDYSYTHAKAKEQAYVPSFYPAIHSSLRDKVRKHNRLEKQLKREIKQGVRNSEIMPKNSEIIPKSIKIKTKPPLKRRAFKK